jgi:hypothetical protein
MLFSAKSSNFWRGVSGAALVAISGKKYDLLDMVPKLETGGVNCCMKEFFVDCCGGAASEEEASFGCSWAMTI